jgi:hypothetical protein
MVKNASPSASATRRPRRPGTWKRTYISVNAVAPRITRRYVGSAIQKIGCRFRRMSRKVPPPVAVTIAMTATPSQSSLFRPAVRTPLTAKTPAPRSSMT